MSQTVNPIKRIFIYESVLSRKLTQSHLKNVQFIRVDKTCSFYCSCQLILDGILENEKVLTV